MQSPTPSSAFLALSTPISPRFGTCLLHPFAFFRRESADAQTVARLADAVASQPTLRHWLLTIASEAPRVRRALIARGAQAMRRELGDGTAARTLEQLADEPTLRAVTETLFRQNGLQPPLRSTGRSARVRLAELGERLAAGESALAAA